METNNSSKSNHDLNEHFLKMKTELYSDSDFIKLNEGCYNVMSNVIIPRLTEKYEDVKLYLEDKPQGYIHKISDILNYFSTIVLIYHQTKSMMSNFEYEIEEFLEIMGITDEDIDEMLDFLRVLLDNIDGFDSNGYFINLDDFVEHFVKARENINELRKNIVGDITDETFDVFAKYDPFIVALRKSMPDEAKIFDDQESA